MSDGASGRSAAEPRPREATKAWPVQALDDVWLDINDGGPCAVGDNGAGKSTPHIIPPTRPTTRPCGSRAGRSRSAARPRRQSSGSPPSTRTWPGDNLTWSRTCSWPRGAQPARRRHPRLTRRRATLARALPIGGDHPERAPGSGTLSGAAPAGRGGVRCSASRRSHPRRVHRSASPRPRRCSHRSAGCASRASA